MTEWFSEITNAHGLLCALNTTKSPRLVRVKRNGHATTYAYDANGNRTHENGQEVAAYDSHDRMLRYRDAQYAYTPSGELLSKTRGDAVIRYTYDALGNLVAVRMPDDTEIVYLIDGANRRIGKKVAPEAFSQNKERDAKRIERKRISCTGKSDSFKWGLTG